MIKADKKQINELLFIERRGEEGKYDLIWCVCVSAKKLVIFSGSLFVDIRGHSRYLNCNRNGHGIYVHVC
jgi:hypothetical protein